MTAREHALLTPIPAARGQMNVVYGLPYMHAKPSRRPCRSIDRATRIEPPDSASRRSANAGASWAPGGGSRERIVPCCEHRRQGETVRRPLPGESHVSRFIDAPRADREQFGASQQYVAVAVHYDAQTCRASRRTSTVSPRGTQPRDDDVQYLLDSDASVIIPAVSAPQTHSPTIVSPSPWRSLRRRRHRTDRGLVQIARDEASTSASIPGWFLDEQREEIARMSALLAVVDRAGTDNMLMVEEYLAGKRDRRSAVEPCTARGRRRAVVQKPLFPATARWRCVPLPGGKYRSSGTKFPPSGLLESRA